MKYSARRGHRWSGRARSFATALALLAFGHPAAAGAQERARQPVLLGTSVSYFAPTKEDRQIHSVFLDAVVGVEVWELLGLRLLGGITATVASGHITQWTPDFVDVRYYTHVAGVGPMVALAIEPIRPLCRSGCAGFSLSLDASGALVLYTSPFPPGGDIYNFAWRVGATLGYALSSRLRVVLGGRWMHVSNGQGLGAFNPSYEGAGVELGTYVTF